ncbi:unnamed protein product [Somion occarium]|uniref:Replication factor A protein 3 n=1 Tax=Somion occarium TaxID=3059160 RepID=A0ABP1CX34_9APHY
MAEIVSPRVNSARLADHVGQHVRLTCKVLRLTGSAAIVEASDGGQVEVRVPISPIKDVYIEVVGQVVEPGVVKLLNCINLGDTLGKSYDNSNSYCDLKIVDMNIVDFVVEKWHSPQFSSMF